MGRELLRARAQKGSSIDPMTLANMATVFPKIGQPDSARVCLAQALAADSSNAIVEYCAALTHWELGDRPRALGWLERAVAGGYPTAWLRDSPVHREWRAEPRFRDLLAAAATVSTSHPSPGGGGR